MSHFHFFLYDITTPTPRGLQSPGPASRAWCGTDCWGPQTSKCLSYIIAENNWKSGKFHVKQPAFSPKFQSFYVTGRATRWPTQSAELKGMLPSQGAFTIWCVDLPVLRVVTWHELLFAKWLLVRTPSRFPKDLRDYVRARNKFNFKLSNYNNIIN